MPLPKDPEKLKLWKERQRQAQTGKSRNKGKANPFYGRKHTEETKAKISIASSGPNNPNWGKPRPQYVKDAISKAHRGKPSAFRGHRHTAKTKAKMSHSRLGNKNRLGKRHTLEQRRLISERTQYAALRGPANNRWKGGVTAEHILARHSFDYIEWREKIFTRDNYTCQICGDNQGGNLHAHHINSFSDYSELRYDLDNGLTVCKPCHEILHSRKL